MRIELTEKCSDHDLPVIDITAQNQQEAFHLGQVMEKMRSRNLVCWHLGGDEHLLGVMNKDRQSSVTIRVPLVTGNELNLVPKPEKE